MPNAEQILELAVPFVKAAWAIEQAEADASLAPEDRKTQVIAALETIEPLVDAAAQLPVGAVEKYLTPGVWSFIYDAAGYLEQKAAAELAAAAQTPAA